MEKEKNERKEIKKNEEGKTNSTKKWLIPVIVCALVLVSVGGYFLYQNVVNQNNNYGGTNLSNKLLNDRLISPNSTNPRNHIIDTISLQVAGGPLTIYTYNYEWFSKTKNEFSCNYAVDRDGKVAMYVEEKNRSWCNGNAANDHRAVTIILSSDTSNNVSSVTIDKLILVMADICQRNQIQKLVWNDNREDRIARTNGANVTIRSDFMRKKTNENKLNVKDIVNRVNEKLGVN